MGGDVREVSPQNLTTSGRRHTWPHTKRPHTKRQFNPKTTLLTPVMETPPDSHGDVREVSPRDLTTSRRQHTKRPHTKRQFNPRRRRRRRVSQSNPKPPLLTPVMETPGRLSNPSRLSNKLSKIGESIGRKRLPSLEKYN